MSRETTSENRFKHLHDPATEGVLPLGFPPYGREGKVRNAYEYGEQICLIASDRVSAFDQVSPTPIPGKGVILNSIAARELQAADDHGIPTWFQEVSEENPRATIGTRVDILPVEMIFRNRMTGSMWREYRETGDFAGFGLSSGLKKWHQFDEPLFTPSTKSDEKDVNFNPKRVEKMTGVDWATLDRMEEVGRNLFRLGMQRAEDCGLILIDTKYEMGLSSDGQLLIGDEVHTPDSSRFVIAEGFDEALARGEEPEELSKEFLRQIMLERAGDDIELAKEMMKDPLPEDVVSEMQHRYQRLEEIFTPS